MEDATGYMRMHLQNGRRDFTQRLIAYGVEGGALVRCKDHPGSVYQGHADPKPAFAIVEAAWERGEISSSLEGALNKLRIILDKAPKGCSHAKCWSK